jgi:hypothetical protein
MPNLNVPFQGQTLIRPGAYYADNVSAVLANPTITTPPLLFLGYGYGVKPQTPTLFSSAQDLLNALRGGPCAAFVPFMATPSPQLFGAQQITYINVGENTQSAYTLLAGAPASGVISLVSTDYGLPSNLLQISVANGTLAGKKVTLFDGYANVTQIGDNLGVPFNVAYTGAASGVTYAVVTSGGVAVSFTTNSPNHGESLAISLTNYPTINDIVEYLNGSGFYSSNVISDGALPSIYLDAVSGVALGAASGVVFGYDNVTATLGDIVYWVNQFATNTLGAAMATATLGIYPSEPALAPTNIPLTPFAGATSVPPVLADYASGFNLGLATPAFAVFADNNTSGVIALGVQHALSASSPSTGKWRRFFSGSNPGDSISSAVTQATQMDAYQATYVYPGIFRTNTTTGANTLYGGLYVAAAAAAMAVGNPPSVALTNKALVGNGCEFNLTISQLNILQQGGVMPVGVSLTNAAIPTIVSDFTTWQLDANPENVFNQQVACRQFLGYSLVNALQPYTGTTADPQDEIKILTAAKLTLNALIYTPNNTTNGVLDAWDASTLQLVFTGSTQVAAISVSVTLVGQNRFITIYVPITPLSITITDTGSGFSAS